MDSGRQISDRMMRAVLSLDSMELTNDDPLDEMFVGVSSDF